MKAKTLNGKSIEEIAAAVDASMADGFEPTLAIVFISIKQDRKAICEILHNEAIDIIRDKELPEADAMLIFSCIGRQSSLGPLLSSELEGLDGTWNKPMAGFLSLGEFEKLDDSRPELHGTTVSWVALKEKN